MCNCKTIAISLEKGGVGKTTTTINLGAALAKQGKRVLLVDFDPQSSLTVSLGLEPDELSSNISTLMIKAIEDKPVPFEEALVHIEDFDIIPGSIELSAVELSLIGVLSREHILDAVLTPLKSQYDFILIDCAPSLGMLTLNALAAADSVLIPMQAQFLSAKGVELLMDIIFKMQRRINPRLSVEGILITMRDKRTRHGREMVEAIRDSFGQSMKVFDTEIPLSVRVCEAAASGKTIFTLYPEGPIAEAYERLAQEVLNGNADD